MLKRRRLSATPLKGSSPVLGPFSPVSCPVSKQVRFFALQRSDRRPQGAPRQISADDREI